VSTPFCVVWAVLDVAQTLWFRGEGRLDRNFVR
jgi:hypothetical protein